MPPFITPVNLNALLASRQTYAFIDIRERGEFYQRQVLGATNVPRRDLEHQMARLVPVKATPVILCDDGGSPRARLAAETLARMGYADVSLLDGGLAAWQSAGYELVEGANVLCKDFGEKVLVTRQVPEITVEEYQARLAGGEQPILIDTRTPEEFKRGTLPGSRNIPNGELSLRITDVIAGRDTPLVIHCGGRTRSIIGAQTLREMGVKNPLVALKNGTMGWLLAGYQLQTGVDSQPLPSPSPQGRAEAERFAARLAEERRIPYLTIDQLQAAQARSDSHTLYLVDVRTSEEYRQGHIPGFQWFPGGQVIQRADEIVAVRAGHLVLACDGRARATLVAWWLAEMGLPNVSVLDGGASAWARAGLPLEQGTPPAVPFGLADARRDARFLTPGGLSEALRDSSPRLVIDLETSRDYAAGHIPGAVWVPRGWLEPRIAAFAPGPAAPVALVCNDGVLSTLASAALRGMGYTRVSVLEGGRSAWAGAGLPLEKGMGGYTGQPDDVVAAIPGDRARMEHYLAWEEALGRKYQAARQP
ncbi:MAG: sulfurtransferase [Chloroflexi bacterium]|nr:sulfurtransferase [Chloroflexota bacterium]